MNITNFEMAQSSLEFFGGLICIIAIITISANKQNRKSLNMLRWMFLTVFFLLVIEGSAYIFRGNTEPIFFVLSKICNFAVFTLNFVLLGIFVRYVNILVEESGGTPKKIYIIVSNICFCLALAILVANIFTGWMYYFDNANYYHREFGWYIYTAISAISGLCVIIQAVENRKLITRRTFIAVILYFLLPFVATILQILIYGISLTNLGLTIAVISLLITRIKDWNVVEDTNDLIAVRKNRSYENVLLFFIMTLAMSASIITCIISINRISGTSSEGQSLVIANMVRDGINNQFKTPIIVSETMSHDYGLDSIIERSGVSPEEADADATTYLESIRDGFDYNILFAVSDKSKAYHTNQGINKVLDPENDAHDIWYKNFLETGRKYELNVDTDEVHNLNLSVFVNSKMEDADGNLVGVCGVGVDMTNLQKLIEEYEEKYDIKITLVKKDGLIQVDSDISRIENEKLDASYFDKIEDKDFYYENQPELCRMTAYMDELDWYIVITDNAPNKINVFAITIPSVIIFSIGVIILALVFQMMALREQRATDELIEKHRVSITDELTGLYNRRAFDEDIEKIQQNGKANKITIIMLDVNGLKFVNDNIGHNAGDELIIGAANCMKTVFGASGKVYRVGGDEFQVITEISEDKLADALKTFDHIVSNWKGTLVSELTISKGYAIGPKHPEFEVEDLMEIADKEMYADKDAYYARTGKTRRK